MTESHRAGPAIPRRVREPPLTAQALRLRVHPGSEMNEPPNRRTEPGCAHYETVGQSFWRAGSHSSQSTPSATDGWEMRGLDTAHPEQIHSSAQQTAVSAFSRLCRPPQVKPQCPKDHVPEPRPCRRRTGEPVGLASESTPGHSRAGEERRKMATPPPADKLPLRNRADNQAKSIPWCALHRRVWLPLPARLPAVPPVPEQRLQPAHSGRRR